MRERLQHLGAVENMTSNGPEFTRWADTRLDRWLVDWSLRNGKERTARKIAKEKNIEVRLCEKVAENDVNIAAYQTLVDIDLFTDIRRIEDGLKRHSCVDALTWCSENKTVLRKIKVRDRNPVQKRRLLTLDSEHTRI